jgi:hypothetical protein
MPWASQIWLPAKTVALSSFPIAFARFAAFIKTAYILFSAKQFSEADCFL